MKLNTGKELPVYLINLEKRKDRFVTAQRELNRVGITDFDLVTGIDLLNGADGIRQTMIGLFTHILTETEHAEVLILEDDVEFLNPDVKSAIGLAMSELPQDYDILFLGANCYKPLKPYSKHLLQLTGAVANHALIYTRKAVQELLTIYTDNPLGITDSLMDMYIVSRGTCYILNPQIAIQRPGFSDIEKRDVDYTPYIQRRFEREVRKLANER